MSSSPYQRVTVEIENGNLAMVLDTDIQNIEYKGLQQVYLYSVQIMGLCLQILQTYQLKGEFQRNRTKISCCLLAICDDNYDNQTPLTRKERTHILVYGNIL